MLFTLLLRVLQYHDHCNRVGWGGWVFPNLLKSKNITGGFAKNVQSFRAKSILAQEGLGKHKWFGIRSMRTTKGDTLPKTGIRTRKLVPETSTVQLPASLTRQFFLYMRNGFA